MAQENLADDIGSSAGTASQTVAEADYRSFCDALGASARGRAFLAEYARRNRHADTEVVLAALGRLQDTARAHQAAPETERIRQDLRALLETLRSARPQADDSPSAIKAATLAALIDFTQARIEAMVSSPDRQPIAEVPPPEQPELPIPQPSPAAKAMPNVLALVKAAMAAPQPAARDQVGPNVTALKADATATRVTGVIPEVNFVDGGLAKAKAPATRAEPLKSAAVVPPPAELIADPEVTSEMAPKVAPAKPVAKKPAAPKKDVEPYELWLDPGLAAPSPAAGSTQAKEQPSAQAETVAEVITPPAVELPPATVVEKPAAKPMTAIAALAARFQISEEPTAETAPVAQAAPAQAKLAPATPAEIAPAEAAQAKADDPLALIMALSEHERLALFT